MPPIQHHRGFGPVAEATTMDKCSRNVTRDIFEVMRFINAETDDRKKDDLRTLYHTCKVFIDRYDGCTADIRAGRDFAKYVVHVWTQLMNQGSGRKLLLVQMGGITIPDAIYYGWWTTIRGITPAQLSTLEVYIAKMTAQAATIPEAIGSLSEDDDDTASVDIDDATATIGNNTTGFDINAVIDRAIETGDGSEAATIINDNMATVAERDNATIDRVNIDQINMTIDEMVKYVAEKTKELLLAEEREKIVNSATAGVETASDAEDARGRLHVTQPTIDTVESMETTSAKIGPIDQTMEDSGIAPTLDSQQLPAPNVIIDTLDGTANTGDDFEPDSGDWFDRDAAALIQSTPQAPIQQQQQQQQGKKNIDLNDKYYCIPEPMPLKSWPIDCDMDCRYCSDSHEIIPIDLIAMNARLDNVRLDKAMERPSRSWTRTTRGGATRTTRGGANPKRKTLREIGRSNAVRESPEAPIKRSPNVKRNRLYGRKGSRGSPGCHVDNLPEVQPVELGLQVLQVQRRLDNLEAKFKN